MLLAACSGGGGGGGGPEVEVVDVDLDLSGQLVAVEDVLLAAVSPGPDRQEGESDTVYRSEDGGRRWEAVTLPGAPAVLGLDDVRPGLVGDLGVVTGQSIEPSGRMPVVGDAFLWTTTDGREWRGGRLAEGVGTSVDVEVAAAGDVLVAGVAVGGGVLEATPYELHRSVDGGATWTPATVPADLAVPAGGLMSLRDMWEAENKLVADLGLGGTAPPTASISASPGDAAALSPDSPDDVAAVQPVLASDDGGATWRYDACPGPAATDDGGCTNPEVHGDLWVRDGEVSVDAGRTWQQPVVEGDVGDGLMFGSVVELPDGGWVATGRTADAGDEDRGHVVRSADGLRWEELHAGACEDDPQGSSFTGLVPFDDGWLTAYDCSDSGERVRSEVYRVGPDATRLEAVPDTLRDGWSYASPTVVAGGVLLLADRADGPSEIVRISP
jgi:hypothetical protein